MTSSLCHAPHTPLQDESLLEGEGRYRYADHLWICYRWKRSNICAHFSCIMEIRSYFSCVEARRCVTVIFLRNYYYREGSSSSSNSSY